ncbi:hypothetical protein ACH347_40410 [Saccharopolyspora sp. 5N102]|uniref:hypothetical protein n=1 Tax=Saccharopolyspora sp. 5N102 TaxID=3375155 RepID=UPI00378F9700
MSPLRWPDGTPVDPASDDTPTNEDHLWLISESIDWLPIDESMRDRIIQRVQAL